MSKGYNGYKNWETWNVALWLSNDEGLYSIVKRCKNWKEAQEALADVGYTVTGDGASLTDSKLSIRELNAFIKEL